MLRTCSQQDVPTVSALIPVGPGVAPDEILGAVHSVFYQSYPLDEILIVTNTHLTDTVEHTLQQLCDNLPTVTLLHEPNRSGLGGALQAGLEAATGEFVARMDADDIAVETRFEMQCSLMVEKNIDILGGQMIEFQDGPQNPQSIRQVPTDHQEIVENIDSRSPFNHPTVMFRRKPVLAAGGYRDYDLMEDWDLWIRCFNNGLQFKNLDEVLVFARAGADLFARRGGYSYFQQELKMQQRLYSDDMIPIQKAVKNVFIRAPVRLFPPTARKYLYRVFARNFIDDK